jgi:hypothetical protein
MFSYSPFKLFILAACLMLTVVTSFADDKAVTPPTQSEPLLTLFQKTIAPALEAKCVACHRPDNLKGGFDLTMLSGMLKGGENGEALIVGKIEESPLYTRAIPDAGSKPEMPEKGEALTTDEASALKQWIEGGAPWPEGYVLHEKAKADANFWSFQPLAKVSPPDVPDAPKEWQLNPIDRFLYDKLHGQNLKPNSPAPPHEFIRRATYDLTGLPPTPTEVEAYQQAVNTIGSDAATEQLIDRLLASPQYGEQWGRHWLDVIRFGESRGYERNQIITNLWPFRDYIIQSFNQDKPFNQLITEHLAGDIVGKDQPNIEIGSAFLVAGPYDDVSNQDPIAAAQIRADELDEMIRATGEAFLGLTIGCSRCHDHKFDPILTKDYYALFTTFAGTAHGERDVAMTQDRQARADKLKPLTEARDKIIAAQTAYEAELTKRITEHEAEAAKKWTRPRLSRYGTEEIFTPVEAKYIRLTIEGRDSEDKNNPPPRFDEFEVWTAEEISRNVALASNGSSVIADTSRVAPDFVGAYGPQLINDGKFGESYIASGKYITIVLPDATTVNRVFFSSDRLRSLKEDSNHTTFVGDYILESSLDGKTWEKLTDSLDRIPPSNLRKLARLRSMVLVQADYDQLNVFRKQIADLDKAIAAIPPLPIWWVGTHKPAPGPYTVLIGGDPQRKGDSVVPASLNVLNTQPIAYQLDLKTAEGDRRLKLAQWLTESNHPLTPRVLANRVWQYHFGTGIVDTPSDFGYMGSRPVHPELLDWLSAELLRHNWQIKPLHKLIMMSQAYRQSSIWRKDAANIDADSRYLWRFPPRRLSAEEVRDTLLMVAGKLNLKMGGPGFKLYEYQQDNVATYVPLEKHGPETYRRAIYHHNARAARVDVLTDFDCPDPSFAEPRRATTTTPLQALTLMNHQFSTDMTQFFAERLQAETSDIPQQVRSAFHYMYSREPDELELKAGVSLIERYGQRAFCRSVLNTNELIYIP